MLRLQPLAALLLCASPGPALAAEPSPALAPDEGIEPSSRWLPAAEALGFNLGLNLFARLQKPPGNEFETDLHSISRNLRSAWVYDVDPFGTNEFQHPYQGSVSFAAARSTGNGFYTSALYALGGSLLWEVAGETEPPSINDQWSTTVGGVFFGETLHRLAALILDAGGVRPGPWRELGAGLISPAGGLNRLLGDNRWREADLTPNPWRGELRLAAAVRGQVDAVGATPPSRGAAAEITGRLTYGLPVGDWEPQKPFDHFDAQASGVVGAAGGSSGEWASLLLRGLVHGATYGSGSSRGLWGLYGHYDYLSPEIFRVSSSGLGLGTTFRHAWGGDWAVGGTALGSMGFGAGGAAAQPVGGRDYHFGSTLSGVAELQLEWAARLALRLRWRHYLVSGRASPDVKTFESLDYGAAVLLVRVAGRHSVGADFSLARRRAVYRDQPEVSSRANGVHLIYVLVTDGGLGLTGG